MGDRTEEERGFKSDPGDLIGAMALYRPEGLPLHPDDQTKVFAAAHQANPDLGFGSFFDEEGKLTDAVGRSLSNLYLSKRLQLDGDVYRAGPGLASRVNMTYERMPEILEGIKAVANPGGQAPVSA